MIEDCKGVRFIEGICAALCPPNMPRCHSEQPIFGPRIHLQTLTMSSVLTDKLAWKHGRVQGTASGRGRTAGVSFFNIPHRATRM